MGNEAFLGGNTGVHRGFRADFAVLADCVLKNRWTSARRPQNLAFAGPDMKTLYIVGGGTDFKVQMLAQGIKSRGGK